MKRILTAWILTLALTGGTMALAHGHGQHHGQGNGQCQKKGKCDGSGKQQARGQKKGPGDCTGNCGNGPRDGTGYGARQHQQKTK